MSGRSGELSVWSKVVLVGAATSALVCGSAGSVSAQAVPRLRTPEARFEGLKGYPYAPHYVDVNGLRMHYVDEGRATRGTFLLLHGEPSWSYLYRNVIPVLTRAGYRAIAPDMIGFGKSDKVTDENWYTIEAHVRQLRGFIEALDLRDVTLVVQDWGGPYGLINATDMPDRFARLVILNTWLHHDGYQYTQALRDWNARSQAVNFSQINGQAWVARSPDTIETLSVAYRAPFHSPESQVGARRWPWMLPFKNPVEGGAERQARAYAALASWKKPAHVIFGDQDQIFNVAWGRQFAAHIPGATFDVVEGAGHMVQEVGAPLAELILQRIGR
jgi:haloalkane dehalogenase